MWDDTAAAKSFRKSFLPADDKIVSVAIAEGLVRKIAVAANDVWHVINARDFCVRTSSVIPIKQCLTAIPAAQKREVAALAANTTFGIASMDKGHAQVQTFHQISVQGDGQSIEAQLVARPILQHVPGGLWAEGNSQDINAKLLIENAIVGFEIGPATPSVSSHTQPIKRDLLEFTSTPVDKAYVDSAITTFTATVPDPGDDPAANTALWDRIQGEIHRNATRDAMLTALGFASTDLDIGERFSADAVLCTELRVTEPVTLSIESIAMATPIDIIEFASFHQPTLADGEYILDVRQHVKIDGAYGWGSDTDPWTAAPSTRLRFAVAGPRFSLDPGLIQSQFPPPKSVGEYYGVIPHIILNRTTLPWERTIDRTIDDKTSPTPWLALLLFDHVNDDGGAPTQTTLTVQDLVNTYGQSGTPPGTPEFVKVLPRESKSNAQPGELKLEVGQHVNDRMTVIDVRKQLLAQIVPSLAEIELMSHVRLGQDAADPTQTAEYPVILCNRLPAPGTGAASPVGSQSTVHLVSLEARKGLLDELAAKPQDNTLVRLISLASWSFSTLQRNKTFTSWLLRRLVPRRTANQLQARGAVTHLRRRRHPHPAFAGQPGPERRALPRPGIRPHQAPDAPGQPSRVLVSQSPPARPKSECSDHAARSHLRRARPLLQRRRHARHHLCGRVGARATARAPEHESVARALQLETSRRPAAAPGHGPGQLPAVLA